MELVRTLLYCFPWRMIILLFLLGEESGSQQLTSNFSKEFVEEDRNVIFYCIPWRTNGSRKTITFYCKRS
jgi:hypothetical protein